MITLLLFGTLTVLNAVPGYFRCALDMITTYFESDGPLSGPLTALFLSGHRTLFPQLSNHGLSKFAMVSLNSAINTATYSQPELLG